MNTNETHSSNYFLNNLVLPNDDSKLITSINNQISIYLTYCGFYGTDFGYEKFLQEQNLNDFSQHTSLFYPGAIKALARDFIKKTNISFETLTQNNTSFESVIYEIYLEYHKHCYHGCAFIDDSILTHGLDASKKHPLNYEYLELASKYNFSRAVIQADFPRIYYSFTPQSSAEYAYSSPSWIGFFINDSRAYTLKNYDDALAKLQSYIKSCDINAEDQKTIIEFFNKSWQTYKDSQPVVLEINNPAPPLSFDEFKALYFKLITPTFNVEQDIVNFFNYLYVMNFFSRENNNFTDKKIPTSDIVKVYYLPHINLLKEKMKRSQKEQ